MFVKKEKKKKKNTIADIKFRCFFFKFNDGIQKNKKLPIQLKKFPKKKKLFQLIVLSFFLTAIAKKKLKIAF